MFVEYLVCKLCVVRSWKFCWEMYALRCGSVCRRYAPPPGPFNNTGYACVECAAGVCHGFLAMKRPVGGVLITATIYPRSPQTKFHSLPFNATSKYLGGRASCWLWSVEVGARY